MTAESLPAPSRLSRVGLVGLGLIGGSVALAVRRAWPQVAIIGLDRIDRVSTAVHQHVVDDTADDLEGLASCELIVFAVPIPALLELMPAISSLQTAAVLTDVGSTKRQIMAATSGMRSFVGGHPMAGSERSGLEHARADLFEQRPWLLVRGSASDRAAAVVEAFAHGLGARPRWLDADSHDRGVAYVSHLPQLLSVALMNAAQEAVGKEGLSVAGRAFAEMTRLAGSPPEMWEAILAENADFVTEALTRFAEHLPRTGDLQRSGWVRESFARASAARSQD